MNTSVKDVKNFISFAAKHLGLSSLPRISLVGKEENTKNAFGHFLGDRKGTSITVRITGRHPIDVMRTIAHELIHYKQRINGVRASEQMKEDEANALAGRIMRDYDTTYPKAFRDKPINEDGMVANAMGASAADPNAGGIQGYSPMLLKNRKPSMLTRLMPKQQKKPKTLRDILNKDSKNEKSQDRK
jgi:hypothetical protein